MTSNKLLSATGVALSVAALLLAGCDKGPSAPRTGADAPAGTSPSTGTAPPPAMPPASAASQ